MVLTLCLCELPWPVVVIDHVGNRSTEVYLLAMLTILNGVGSDIRRLSDDISRVLLVPVVLLNFNKVSHMFISCSVISLLDLALMFEAFFISDSDLSLTVFFACQSCDRLFILVAKTVITWFTEQDLIYGLTLLNWIGTDVGWVDHDFFDLTIWVQSRYIQKKLHGKYT